MSWQTRYVRLAAAKPAALSHLDTTPQRTPAWFKKRSGTVSGSKLSSLLFCKTEEELQQYRGELVGTRARPPLDAEALKRCQWGTDHEIDATASALAALSDMHFYECGFEVHPNLPWLGSSPDGIVALPSRLGDQYGVLECKCSCKRNAQGKSVPHPSLPWYYIPQTYFEMRATRTYSCVFVSWGETGTHVWLLRFDPAMWAALFELVTDLLLNDLPYELFQKRVQRYTIAARRHASEAEALHPKGGFPSLVGQQEPH